MKRTLMALALCLTISPALFGAAPLEIRDPWVREPNPGRPVGAAFMTLTNNSDAPAVLVGASSKAAEVVEIHEMKTEDGVMKMRMIESLEIPAKSTVTLEPGGYHLMLIRLTGTLKDGDEVELELKLEGGETVKVKAPVKKMEMQH